MTYFVVGTGDGEVAMVFAIILSCDERSYKNSHGCKYDAEVIVHDQFQEVLSR